MHFAEEPARRGPRRGSPARAKRLLPLALTLAGCKMARETRPPAAAMPATWRGAAAEREPPERWWLEFGDPDLDRLVERAVRGSLDLEIARARVLEARAERDAAAGEARPALDAGASVSRSQSSGNTIQDSLTGARPRNLFDAGFDASWEVDLFGRIDASVAAAQAGLEAAEEARRDARVTLVGEVAREYVGLRGLQRGLAVTRGHVEVQRRTRDLTRARLDAGLATELDLARAETLLSTTLAQAPALEAGIAAAMHRLAVLVGEPPASLEDELSGPRPVPRPPEVLAAGLPSDLLRRRSDVRRAEREVARAAALTEAAAAELFPRLTLTGSVGLQSASSGDLLDAGSRTWSIGGALLAPVFEGGRLRANVRVQDARHQAAIAAYEKAVLQALAEVEDALAALALERERAEALESALSSSRRAAELAGMLYERGLADSFELLEAQRSQLAVESDLARSATALAEQGVALFKALGGGWEKDGDG